MPGNDNAFRWGDAVLKGLSFITASTVTATVGSLASFDLNEIAQTAIDAGEGGILIGTLMIGAAACLKAKPHVHLGIVIPALVAANALGAYLNGNNPLQACYEVTTAVTMAGTAAGWMC